MTNLTKWLNTRDISARDAVIEEHTPMIRKMARAKWKGKLFDDFLGAAYEGAIHALNTYDPAKTTDVKAHIYWQVKAALKKHGRLELKAMKQYTDLDDDDRNNEIHDDAPSAFERTADMQRSKAVQAAIMGLGSRDRAIIVQRVYLGRLPREIAEANGVTRQAIQQREQRIMARLRETLSDYAV